MHCVCRDRSHNGTLAVRMLYWILQIRVEVRANILKAEYAIFELCLSECMYVCVYEGMNMKM